MSLVAIAVWVTGGVSGESGAIAVWVTSGVSGESGLRCYMSDGRGKR